VIATWRRLRALSRADRLLVIEAAWLLSVVWLTLKSLDYPSTRWLIERYARLTRRISTSSVPPERLAWAVVSVADRLPVRITCLPRAIVGHAMLVGRGYPSELRIGVLPRRLFDTEPLQSHAWTEYEGTVLIGELDNLGDYAVLTARGEPS
jgi:hypothetical protein